MGWLCILTLLKFNVSLRGEFLEDEQGLRKTATALSLASILTLLKEMMLDFEENLTGHLQGLRRDREGKTCPYAKKVASSMGKQCQAII
jgi:hypothetical protein